MSPATEAENGRRRRQERSKIAFGFRRSKAISKVRKRNDDAASGMREMPIKDSGLFRPNSKRMDASRQSQTIAPAKSNGRLEAAGRSRGMKHTAGTNTAAIKGNCIQNIARQPN